LSRFFGLSALFVALSIMAPTAARADDDRDEHHGTHTRAVPELSTSGAASALAVLAGAGAIAFGRKRRRGAQN
jgi:hypothetical protein